MLLGKAWQVAVAAFQRLKQIRQIGWQPRVATAFFFFGLSFPEIEFHRL